jgi:hypothetical protein
MGEKKRLRWNAVIDRVKNIEGPVIGAELGVWKGNMSYHLLYSMPNLTLIMVDRWAPPVPGDSYHTSGSEMALCDKKKFDKVYAEALERIFLFRDRTKIIETTTEEASKQIDDHYLDFCFIDADHSYEGVKNDIIHWKDKVKPGGWLCGHDWGNLKKGNVKKAVEEFFSISRIELDCNSTWFVRM